MSIIKPQSLTESSRETLINFLNCGVEISKEEVVCWIRLWKLREKANVYLAKNSCVFKALEEISSTNLPVLKLEEGLKIYDETQKFGGNVITPRHAEYPSQLKEIVDFPLAIHCFGNVKLLQKYV